MSLEKTAICGISGHRNIVKDAPVARDHDGAIAAVGLEAGPLPHCGFSETEHPVVLKETRQVKGALKVMPIKTDRLCAKGIARLPHLGWFRPVHRKLVSVHEVRAALARPCNRGSSHWKCLRAGCCGTLASRSAQYSAAGSNIGSAN